MTFNKSENLPIHDCRPDGLLRFRYVRLDEIPEPHRSAFLEFLHGRGGPVMEGEGPCAYVADWLEYLRRLTNQ